MEEVRHAGQTYLRPTGGQAGNLAMSIYTPDDRTAVLAADDLLRVLIEDRKEPKARPSWNDAWSQVAKGQINAVLETRWLRRRLNQGEIEARYNRASARESSRLCTGHQSGHGAFGRLRGHGRRSG